MNYTFFYVINLPSFIYCENTKTFSNSTWNRGFHHLTTNIVLQNLVNLFDLQRKTCCWDNSKISDLTTLFLVYETAIYRNDCGNSCRNENRNYLWVENKCKEWSYWIVPLSHVVSYISFFHHLDKIKIAYTMASWSYAITSYIRLSIR